MYVVGKSFTAEGIIRRTGEVVKASGWRHVKRLLEQRYLAVFDGEPVKCTKCGRMFVNDELLQDHIRMDHPEPETTQEEPEQAQQGAQTQKAIESKPAEQKTEQKDAKLVKTGAKADTSKEAAKEAKPKTNKPERASKENEKRGK